MYVLGTYDKEKRRNRGLKKWCLNVLTRKKCIVGTVGLGGNHWSRRSEMGESVQCHSARACTEWTTQYFLLTAWLDCLIPFPLNTGFILAGVSQLAANQ